jgi:hypothetical protein
VTTPSTTSSDDAVVDGWYDGFLRFTTAVVHFGALLPVLWLVSVYAFVIRVRFRAGEWPPADTWGYDRFADAFQFHEGVINAGIFALPFIFVSWLPIAGFAALTRRALSGRRFLCLLSLWFVVPAVAMLDPFHLLQWWFSSE